MLGWLVVSGLLWLGIKPVQAAPFAYITNAGSNTVSVIDTATNAVTVTVPVGRGPVGVAVHPAGTFVYVVNKDDFTVSVIATATNTVVATVPVGVFPTGVAVHPAGTFVYVTELLGNVSVMATATNTVVTNVPVGSVPTGIAVHPTGTFVYVGDRDFSVIATATNTVVATVPTAGLPTGLAVHPSGTFVYVATDDRVSVVATATNTVIATVPVRGSSATGVAVHPSGTFVYVASSFPNTISVIATATNTLVATVPVGAAPEGVAVHPAGTFVYVTNSASNSVSVIATATNTVVATVPVGNFPRGLGQFISPFPPSVKPLIVTKAGTGTGTVTSTPPGIVCGVDCAETYPTGAVVTLTATAAAGSTFDGWSGAGCSSTGTCTVSMTQARSVTATFNGPVQATPLAYITNIDNVISGSGNVSVIATTTNTVISAVPVGEGPRGVAVHPAGTFVYVANELSNSVSVIATATNTVAATVPVGNLPTGVAVHPAGTFVYVTNTDNNTVNNNTVSVIATATNTVATTVPVGASPEGVAVHPAGTFVYVTNSASNSVSVIATATNTVVTTVPVGLSPRGVAVHPAGTFVYVTGGNNVLVIATTTNTVVTTVPVGLGANGVAVHPAGTFVYVVSGDGVSVINTATNAVVTTVRVGALPSGLAVHPAGTFVYVKNFVSDSVSVIATATNTVVATVPVRRPSVGLGQFVGLVPAGAKPLSVTKAGTGTGTVTSAPPGIACGADCTETYPASTVVTLTSTAAAGSTFAGWSGAGCSGTGRCKVGMTQARSVTATFNGSVLRINDVSQAEGNVGATLFTFTATLSPSRATPVTVNYATANGTATAGSDYTATSGSLTFTPGQTSRTIVVPVSGDALVEGNETFVVNLSGVVGAAILDSQGVGTILNDDGPVLRITDVVRAEGNAGTTHSVFTVTLSPAASSSVMVNYTTANGSALAGSDYTATSGSLTFASGQTSKTIAVAVLGDTIAEGNETFVVNLSAAVGATLFDAQGLGTILNDDGPVLRINDVSQAEGNAGTTHSVFTVTLSPAASGAVTVNYVTVNGSAVAGSDYTATSGSLTFAPGQTSKTIAVPVLGDTTVEANETFVVNLSAAVGATLFDAQGLGTILNDDGPVLRPNDVSRAEGNSGAGAFTFTVTLSPASANPVTVNYATANGTATAGSDYTATSGTLTFTPGQTSKTIVVPVMGDTTVEANETFVVNLSVAVGATLFDAQGLGTILNDDGPVLRITDMALAEGNSGTGVFIFLVTLSPASASNVTVNYVTANGTATAGSDYTAISGTLTFTPGQTLRTIAVPVLGDDSGGQRNLRRQSECSSGRNPV